MLQKNKISRYFKFIFWVSQICIIFLKKISYRLYLEESKWAFNGV